MTNPKLQTPSSKLRGNTKSPAPNWVLRRAAGLGPGAWSFSGAWNLVLGAWCLGFLVLAGFNATAAELTPAQTQFFESNIRPILVNNCYKCHSSQAEKVKGGLLLDSREGVLKGGESGPAIVPGDPEQSRLIKAVRYTDPDLQMPPKDKKLSDAEIADLTTWVKMGAPDPRTASPGLKARAQDSRDHWAWQPLSKPAVPAIQDVSWP